MFPTKIRSLLNNFCTSSLLSTIKPPTLRNTQCSRRKSDIPKSSAAEFSSPENLVNEFMQGTSPDYIRDCIQELRKIKFVRCTVIGTFRLEDPAIIYMENRFKNGLKEVTDFISKFIP